MHEIRLANMCFDQSKSILSRMELQPISMLFVVKLFYK